MTDYSWPTDLVPYAMTFFLRANSGGSESPFTKTTKTYAGVPQWVCRMSFRGGYNEDWGAGVGEWGARLDAFLAKLKGRENRVALWDFRREGTVQAWISAAIIAGAPTTTITGGSPAVGEYISGDGRPHIVQEFSGAGPYVVTFAPPMRSDIAASGVGYSKAFGMFRLVSDDAPANPTEIGQLVVYDLEFVEDLGPIEIVGEPFVGSTLSADGEWDTYQWLLDGVAISGATSSTYVVQSGDEGGQITLRVGVTNGATATTAPVVARYTEYLGQVATRCYFPNNRAGANEMAMVRTPHYARDTINSLVVGHPNWFVATTSSGPTGTGEEVGGGGDMFIRCGVEYPEGTVTAFEYSGGATGTAADGTTIFTDELTVYIPDGELFWIRTFVSYSTGGNMPFTGFFTGGQIATTGLGEQAEFGPYNTLTNKVLTGTMPVATTANYYPCAILSNTRKPSVFIIGDSRSSGTHGTADTSTDTGEIAMSIGREVGYINGGIPSDRLQWYATKSAKRRALAAYCTDVIGQLGVNDLNNGRTKANLEADLATVVAFFSTKRVFWTTTMGFAESTDDWRTVANQTPFAGESERVLWNNYIRTKPSPLIDYFDVSDALESSRNSGAWKVNGSPFYINANSGHENSNGYAMVRNSGKVKVGWFA